MGDARTRGTTRTLTCPHVLVVQVTDGIAAVSSVSVLLVGRGSDRDFITTRSCTIKVTYALVVV